MIGRAAHQAGVARHERGGQLADHPVDAPLAQVLGELARVGRGLAGGDVPGTQRLDLCGVSGQLAGALHRSDRSLELGDEGGHAHLGVLRRRPPLLGAGATGRQLRGRPRQLRQLELGRLCRAGGAGGCPLLGCGAVGVRLQRLQSTGALSQRVAAPLQLLDARAPPVLGQLEAP